MSFLISFLYSSFLKTLHIDFGHLFFKSIKLARFWTFLHFVPEGIFPLFSGKKLVKLSLHDFAVENEMFFSPSFFRLLKSNWQTASREKKLLVQ